MHDKEIVALYWNRDESAITETSKRYGKYCFSIAFNILNNHEDAEAKVHCSIHQLIGSIMKIRPRLRADNLLWPWQAIVASLQGIFISCRNSHRDCNHDV